MALPVVIYLDTQAPVDRMVAGALSAYIKDTGRDCYIYGMEKFSIASRFNLIAINMGRKHIPPNILKGAHGIISWLVDDIDWRDGATDQADLYVGYTNYLHGDNLKCIPLESPVPFYIKDNEICNKNNKYDIVFIGNRSDDVYSFLSNPWTRNELQVNNIEVKPIIELTHKLEDIYNKGLKICGYKEFETFLKQDQKIAEQLDALTQEARHWVLDLLLYWGVNERLYRQTVIRWLVDMDCNMAIAGCGWEWTGKSVGYLESQDACNNFLSQGKYGLHLNSLEGIHHRLWQMALAGNKIITRGYGCCGSIGSLKPDDYESWWIAEVDRILNSLDSNAVQEENPIVHYTPGTIGFESKLDLYNILKA